MIGGVAADPHTYTPLQFNGFPAPDPVATAADAPTKSPTDRALAQLIGTAMTPGLLVELCNALFPESTDSNKRALTEWQERHKATLALIDRNEEAFVLRNAHGDRALTAKVRQLYHDRSYADFREQYKKDPTGIEATCQSLPRVLPKLDIDSRNVSEVATLRAHPIATGDVAPKDR